MKVNNSKLNQAEFKIKLTDLAQAITVDCLKFCPPTTDNKDYTKSNAAINVACLRVIRFKQKNSLGLFNIIRAVKIIRKQLRLSKYNLVFVNDISLYLIKAFMRTPTIESNHA